MIDILEKIKQEEGFCADMYDCPSGYKTIGYGINLETTPIPEPIARAWTKYLISGLNLDIAEHDWYRKLDHDRRMIILDMCYQMGVNGVLRFKKMIAAIEGGDYEEAANQMMDSKWARHDSPARALRNATIMRDGE